MWLPAPLAIVVALLAPVPAGAAPQDAACRNNYPPRAVVADIKARVEGLRRIEREAADRVTGLDTRPYPWLLGHAQEAHAAIAVPALLAAEQDVLNRCPVVPLRRDCSGAAAALVQVIKELAAGTASNEARMALAQGMTSCERAAGLKASDTALRSFTPAPESTDGRREDGAR